MSRRRPTKADYNRVVTIDLLADWRPYAEPLPEPRSDSDWVYFGTITRDGVTGAPACALTGTESATERRWQGRPLGSDRGTSLLVEEPPMQSVSSAVRPCLSPYGQAYGV